MFDNKNFKMASSVMKVREESRLNYPRPLERVLLESLEHMAKYIVRTTIIFQSNPTAQTPNQ